MAMTNESRTVHDPFHGKDVQISNRLTDRLRGKYASGPTMPNGEPEFGWRETPKIPIQSEAADVIDEQAATIRSLRLKLDGERERIANAVITRYGTSKSFGNWSMLAEDTARFISLLPPPDRTACPHCNGTALYIGRCVDSGQEIEIACLHCDETGLK